MRRIVSVSLIGLAGLLSACGERVAQPTAPPTRVTSALPNDVTCIAPDSIRHLITNLLPPNDKRTNALNRFDRIVTELAARPPLTTAAQSDALSLVSTIVGYFKAGVMLGDNPTVIQANAQTLLDAILCTAGLPPLPPGVLDPNGAAGYVGPTSPTTTIVTPAGNSGLQVPGGAAPTGVLITVTRLNLNEALRTVLDQYPPFFEIHYTPAITFTTPVVVAVCQTVPINPPDPTRLRLAHAIAPFGAGDIEILPIVPAPFLNCANAQLGAAPRVGPLQSLAAGGARLARSLFMPQDLFASPYFASTGVAGSVRNFSPFGAVDPFGIASATTPTSQNGVAGQPVAQAPMVTIMAPTGHPMPGITVTFAVTAGGGTLGTTSVKTDANGVASAGSWTLGSLGSNVVVATASYVSGTVFQNNPITFTANAQ